MAEFALGHARRETPQDKPQTNHTEKMRYSTKNRKRDPIRDELRDSIRKIALCLAIVAGGWVAGAAGMLIYILFTA